MSKFSVGSIATGAGSATLPFGSLYSATTITPRIREIGIFNTTTTACNIKLVRISTAGTKGAGITVGSGLNAVDPATAVMTAFQAHTVAPTFTDIGYRAPIGAAIGAGIIWTFDDWELTLAASATAGLGLIGDGATPQILDWYASWIE
jgi:hypothetical protein